jgi:hypothetical protein
VTSGNSDDKEAREKAQKLWVEIHKLPVNPLSPQSVRLVETVCLFMAVEAVNTLRRETAV